MSETSGRVKVGCCGFPTSVKKYFSQSRLVEIQQTFYKVPQQETALHWRQQAPADFQFSLKAWQVITHLPVSPTYRKAGLKIPQDAAGDYGFFKPTEAVRQAWAETMKFARALQAKVIVFQCPPSFSETAENVENLRRFFAPVRDSGFLFAWEPRGNWHESTIKAICSEFGLIHCVDPMERESLCGEPKYFRLHGGPHYRHRYSEAELKRLIDMIGESEAYVLFNNIDMSQDALVFEKMLANERC